MSGDRVLSAAETELLIARAALAGHMRGCPRPGKCGDCKAWADHVGLCERQVALLAPPDDGQEALP